MKQFLAGRQASSIALLSLILSACGGGGGDEVDDEVVADTTAPSLTQVTAVPTPTTDTTPNYTFSSTEAGTITYGGSCSSTTTSAMSGNNTITFNTLSDGTYSNCNIQVTDAAGNVSSVLVVSSFIINTMIADTTAPTLTQVTAVPTPTTDTTPNYTFSSTEAGTITYGGSCSSTTTSAVSGNNTITFSTLSDGTYSDCNIQVTDAAGNVSPALTVSPFTINPQMVVTPRPLNDTGITLCGDYAYDDIPFDNNDVDCTNGASPSATITQVGLEIANGNHTVPAGQDAHFGRDANESTNDDSDGHKGFSYTKLDAAGEELASDATSWSCVRDNVTGLIWEVKTNDGGLRDQDWQYTWYNSTGVNTGGSAGVSDGWDYCEDATRCDIEKFVADVNDLMLCGASDWRVPSRDELKSLLNRGAVDPSIDTAYFPNTLSNTYWTSSPLATDRDFAWYVFFDYGYENAGAKWGANAVRLVRSSQ